jgi:hypothetical protein
MNTCCHCGPVCDEDALCDAARPQPSQPIPDAEECAKLEEWTANYNNCYSGGAGSGCGISQGTSPFTCNALVPDPDKCPPHFSEGTPPLGECQALGVKPVACPCISNGRNYHDEYYVYKIPNCPSSSTVSAVVNLDLLSTLLDIPIQDIENMDYMNLENLKDSKIQETIDQIKKINE